MDHSRRIAQIIVVGLFLLALVPFLPFKVDDAYISFVYAKNLIEGHGLTYNGMLVEGFSDPLWVLLLAPFIRIASDPIVIARLFSIIAGAVTSLIMLEFAWDIVGDERTALAALATGLIVVQAPLAAWAMGGLETIFLAALITSLVYVEWRGPPDRYWVAPSLLLAIALTRPEGGLVFVAWLVHRVTSSGKHRRRIVAESLLFAIPFAAAEMALWWDYGFPLPNTAYLKLAPSVSTTAQAAGWIWGLLLTRPFFGLVLLIGVVAMLAQRRDRAAGVRLAAVITVGFLGFVVLSGGDWMPHYRFLAPVMPLAVIPAAASIAAFNRPAFRLGVIGLAVAGIVFEVGMAWTLYRPVSADFGGFTDGLIEAGEWINQSTDKGATIAVVDAGALAFYGERTTIDIAGLNNVHIAHTTSRSDVRYVIQQAPQVIELHLAFTKTGELLPAKPGTLDEEMLRIPEFGTCYRPQTERPDNPYYPFMFLRTCSK